MLKKLSFIFLFIILALILNQVPINKIIGSEQSFTLLEFIGPTAGAFLGGILGAGAVVFVKLINTLFLKKELDFLTIVRFFPMAFAALYFGTKAIKKNYRKSARPVLDKALAYLSAAVPAVCVVLFWLHPEGRKAFLFAFFWFIPVIASFYKKNLWLKSLGATFTAHAVGSVAFLYAFNLPAAVWYSLIPVVLIERGFFTIGIASFYVLFNSVLGYAAKFTSIKGLKFENKYLISKVFRG